MRAETTKNKEKIAKNPVKIWLLGSVFCRKKFPNEKDCFYKEQNRMTQLEKIANNSLDSLLYDIMELKLNSCHIIWPCLPITIIFSSLSMSHLSTIYKCRFNWKWKPIHFDIEWTIVSMNLWYNIGLENYHLCIIIQITPIFIPCMRLTLFRFWTIRKLVSF